MVLSQQRFKHPLAAAALTGAATMWPATAVAQQWELMPAPDNKAAPQRFATVADTTKLSSGSLQWSVISPQTTTTADTAPLFEPAAADQTNLSSSGSELNWQPLTAEEAQKQQETIQAEILKAQEDIANPTTVLPPSGPTYANFRALWRDGDWLPQISNTVPIGFGPQGLMATLEYRGIDCITGAGYCKTPTSYQDWSNTISRSGDAFFDTSIGFGDSLKAIGIVLTAVSENTNTSFGDRSGNGETIFGNINLGLHLTKNLSPDTSIRLGIENLVREDCYGGACGLPQNAYGVLTQRIRIQDNQATWLPNAYITMGAGNGAYRPLSEQVQASIAAQRAAGCSTYGYAPKKDCSPSTRRRAVYDAASYGNLTPIGAVGVEVFRGFHLIGEWSGRNLNAGLSFRPFEELGLVITPMWENLLPNCDYGCKVSVPDYPQGAPIPSNLLTERARFSIQASVEIKF